MSLQNAYMNLARAGEPIGTNFAKQCHVSQSICVSNNDIYGRESLGESLRGPKRGKFLGRKSPRNGGKASGSSFAFSICSNIWLSFNRLRTAQRLTVYLN